MALCISWHIFERNLFQQAPSHIASCPPQLSPSKPNKAGNKDTISSLCASPHPTIAPSFEENEFPGHCWPCYQSNSSHEVAPYNLDHNRPQLYKIQAWMLFLHLSLDTEHCNPSLGTENQVIAFFVWQHQYAKDKVFTFDGSTPACNSTFLAAPWFIFRIDSYGNCWTARSRGPKPLWASTIFLPEYCKPCRTLKIRFLAEALIALPAGCNFLLSTSCFPMNWTKFT